MVRTIPFNSGKPINISLESLVIIYSRLNHLVQAYSFNELSSGSSALIVASDPITLDLELHHQGYTSQLHIETMDYGETRQENFAPGPGHSYLELGFEFYRVYALRSDLSIHELVFHTPGHSEKDSGTVIEDFKRSMVRRPRRDIPNKEVIDDWANFLAPNGLDEADKPGFRIASQAPEWIQSWKRPVMQRGRDYRLIYDALTQPENDSDEGSGLVDISVVTTELKQMLLDEPGGSTPPIGTL